MPKECFNEESRAIHLADTEAVLAHSGELCYRHSDLTNMCIFSNTLSSVGLIHTFVRILTNHSFEGFLGCTTDSDSHSDFKAVSLVFTF